MTESERLLRSILGPTRSDIRPLAFAIAVAEELLFNQGLAMDDVQITKQIYPMVARQFRKTDNAAAKCVERLSRLCWEAMVAQDLVAQYLGRAIQQSPTPRSLIVYLAVYSHTGSPFYTVIEEDPYFLFQLPESVPCRQPIAHRRSQRSKAVPQQYGEPAHRRQHNGGKHHRCAAAGHGAVLAGGHGPQCQNGQCCTGS